LTSRLGSAETKGKALRPASETGCFRAA